MRLIRSVCVAVALAGCAGSAFAVESTDPATFEVSESTKVPGLTLSPGTYSIRVVDHLSDRLIVRVDNQQGSTHSTFIGVQNSSIPQPSAPGAVPWSGKAEGTTALRGFEFPGGGPVVEFVYPKEDAVAIAKGNSAKVPAIDPASEGKSKVKDASLSKDDMEVVTLWMLSSTQVGPDNAKKPAIAAEKLQVANTPAPAPVAAPAPAPQPAPQPAAPVPVEAKAKPQPQTPSNPTPKQPGGGVSNVQSGSQDTGASDAAKTVGWLDSSDPRFAAIALWHHNAHRANHTAPDLL